MQGHHEEPWWLARAVNGAEVQTQLQSHPNRTVSSPALVMRPSREVLSFQELASPGSAPSGTLKTLIGEGPLMDFSQGDGLPQRDTAEVEVEPLVKDRNRTQAVAPSIVTSQVEGIFTPAALHAWWMETCPRKPCEGLFRMDMPDGSSKKVIELQADCYSIAAVEDCRLVPAVLLPLASAIAQLLVLYFLAFSSENRFDEGLWLQPFSTNVSLNMLKVIATLVSLFKASTEMLHARQLCRALIVGEFHQPHNWICGYWALVLQYAMALSVLFVSLSLVIGSRTPSGCVLKIFSVFVTVDMDNLAAKFIEAFWGIDFCVQVHDDRVEDLAWGKRPTVGQIGGLLVNILFFYVPVGCILVTSCAAALSNTLPLTLISNGVVSNIAPPKMINALDGDCCRPNCTLRAVQPNSGLSADCSVLLLGLPLPGATFAVPPHVYWVAFEAQSQPRPPSSLQVVEGFNGDGIASPISGNDKAKPAQANYWLQLNGYRSTTYQRLLVEEKLYKHSVPFEVHFSLDGLAAGAEYRVYVSAQNPMTKALSPVPAASDLLRTSACPPLCASCDISGPQFCDRCSPATYRNSMGTCTPCTENCVQCNDKDALWRQTFELLESPPDVIPCDLRGCERGFGVEEGHCKKCKVDACLNCDDNNSLCQHCEDGFGFDLTMGSCQQCSSIHCRCSAKGGCDFCVSGYGLSPNGTCVACAEGCDECLFAHDECKGCALGWGKSGPKCVRCPQHCVDCLKSGPNGCDSCRSGYGFSGRRQLCEACEPEHCETCDGEDPKSCRKCKHGYGLTPGGLCDTCGESCLRCGSVDACSECELRFALKDGQCWGCADGCDACQSAGPGLCDQCTQGFQLNGRLRTCHPIRAFESGFLGLEA